jgi:hypothetical protein
MTMDSFKAWVFNPALSVQPLRPGVFSGGKKGPSNTRSVQSSSVQNLAQRQGQMPQSEESVFSQLRRSGDQGLRSVGEELRDVPAGRWRETNAAAHTGAEEQQRQLHARTWFGRPKKNKPTTCGKIAC